MFEKISLCQQKSYQPHYKILGVWADVSPHLTCIDQVRNITNTHTHTHTHVSLIEQIHIICKLHSLILSLVLIINTSCSMWFFKKKHKLYKLSNNLWSLQPHFFPRAIADFVKLKLFLLLDVKLPRSLCILHLRDTDAINSMNEFYLLIDTMRKH